MKNRPRPPSTRKAVVSGGRGRRPLQALPAPESSAAPQNPFPIVGVGASAGGLDAFKLLLEALPDDTGMAYVLVQHMSAQQQSMLAELLGRSCRMSVREIADGMPVE